MPCIPHDYTLCPSRLQKVAWNNFSTQRYNKHYQILRATKLAQQRHAHSVQYAHKLVTTKRAIENKNTSHSQTLSRREVPEDLASTPGGSKSLGCVTINSSGASMQESATLHVDDPAGCVQHMHCASM
eukprot:1151441-Pelagomonas_calceolata.AAC.1